MEKKKHPLPSLSRAKLEAQDPAAKIFIYFSQFLQCVKTQFKIK